MKTTILTLVLTALLPGAALAHPGHGLPAWLHHGELVILASVVVTAGVAWWLGWGRNDAR